jgi:hypothetical protein
MGDNLFSRCLLAVNRALIPMWPQMFSYQIYIEAKFLPPVDRLLAQTIQASSERTRKDSHR